MTNRRVAHPSRRRLLRTATRVGALALLPRFARASDLDVALRDFAGGATIAVGRVRLDIAVLIENGNAAPVTIDVDSPMTPTDHVRRIALFNERNPQRDVAIFTLGPRSGRASVSTRIRLATSQHLVAVAEMSDRSFWRNDVDVIVTLAACIEV